MIRCRTYARLAKPALLKDPRTGQTQEYATEVHQDGAHYGHYAGEPVAGLLHFLNTMPGVRAMYLVHEPGAVHVYYEDTGCGKRIESPSTLQEVKK